MTVIIDSNIPVPSDLSCKDKLDMLSVGQSMPVMEGSEETYRQTAWRHFHKAGTGKVFTIRKDPTDPKNYRVWRVK